MQSIKRTNLRKEDPQKKTCPDLHREETLISPTQISALIVEVANKNEVSMCSLTVWPSLLKEQENKDMGQKKL